MPSLLSDEELEFYSRQIVLRDIGYAGQLMLKEATVAVAGLGGLGSPLATQLTAMGIGHVRLIDRDIVEKSNLQRQHLYGVDVIGRPKVEAAAERLRRLNPHVELEPVPLSIGPRSAELLLKGADVVVDGLDRMTPRYALNRAAVRLGVPYVFGAAIEMFGNTSTILPKTTPCLECFMPGLNDELLATCAVVGVHPSIIGMIASVQASETIRLLLGETPRLAGRLLYCDLRALTFDAISISRHEQCPICGEGAEAARTEVAFQAVEELCSRGGRRSFIVNSDVDMNLDVATTSRAIEEEGYEARVQGGSSISFASKHGVTATLLKSGILLVEGASDQSEVARLYRALTGVSVAHASDSRRPRP